MPRIHQLEYDVINKIAAGEVIERPGSVIKELLENAVDAGATRIQVDVEQGGTELMRVVDNGCGIEAEDLPLAFASHATSKLNHPDDLWAIRSMGFRGEALASIGSVAKVRLQSCPAGKTQGAELVNDGGSIGPVQSWSGQPGTRIEVRHLFFNVPARRKFLRSPSTELGHITEAFTRIALGFPHVHLKLTHNGRLLYDLAPSASLTDRVVLFFGEELRDKLIKVEKTHSAVHLSGLIADPALNRGNARLQYLFLNGRCIRDRTLSHALQEAYHGLLMTARYAVAFLFLEIPPDHVDINVHPTKAEVRFRDSQALHHFVLTTLRERLRQSDLTAPMTSPLSRSNQPPSSLSVPIQVPETLHSSQSTHSSVEPREFERSILLAGQPSKMPSSATGPTEPIQEIAAKHKDPLAPTSEAAVQPAITSPVEKTLRALQMHNTYLVVETEQGMLVIDQHALHERILFEELKKRILSGPLEVQRLLIPEPVDLPPEQAATALEHQDALARLGLEIQDFGHGTILVMTYPTFLSKHPPASLMRKVVEHLASVGKAPALEILLNDALAIMACHAAVKAGDPIGEEEIATLVARRDLLTDTHHCPHGRPTSLFFSKHELERQFQRI